jgi:DMSO/TMAO reductase YedYZ molybdopterin-dependent catalytic subunit
VEGAAIVAQATQRFDALSVSICGDVERPACLALPELHALMDAELVADFHCREGWSRLGECWRGVRFRTLLALARLGRQADQP